MQFSRNFSGLAVFVLALAGVGMTTPIAAVSTHVYPSSSPFTPANINVPVARARDVPRVP